MDVTERHAAFLEVNGARLYYEVAGAGEPIVFIHGHALDCRMWDDQFDLFARTHRAIRYDMRGFGRSSPPTNDPYSPSADLAALLSALGVERAHLVGLSLGGERAIEFALARPDATRSLVAVDAGLAGWRWTDFRAFFTEVLAAGAHAGANAARETWLHGPIFAPARERADLAERLFAMTRDYSGWHWTGNREARLPSDPPEPPAIERLDRIACPTLVVVGERDIPDFLEIATMLADRIPGAAHSIIAGAGHLPNMEAPEHFNELLADFLSRVDLPWRILPCLPPRHHINGAKPSQTTRETQPGPPVSSLLLDRTGRSSNQVR